MLLDNSIDLSKEGDGTVMKSILRTGDHTNGHPVALDSVHVAWTFKLKDGTIAHRRGPRDASTIQQQREDEKEHKRQEEDFTFTLGSERSEVIPAWELAIPTMFEGEIASLTIQPSMGFGEAGAPPLIPPNEPIICELELISIIPSLRRAYKQVGLNESIKDELMEKIESGESVISDQVAGTSNGVIEGDPNDNENAKDSVRMFDETKMKLDPNQRVGGEGKGHVWEEGMGTMDVEVAIPQGTQKSDLIVDISHSSLKVALRNGETIIEGPLHGRISPHDCMWALADHDPLSRIKGRRLVFALEKTYGHRDLWCTVFDREYLRNGQTVQSALEKDLEQNYNYIIKEDD